MNLFKKVKKSQNIVQTAPSKSETVHPFSALNRYVPLSDTEVRLYESLREAVPIIDSAICKTIRLMGYFDIECENKKIEKQLKDFFQYVKVGASGQGIQSFIGTYMDQLLTYGTAIGEIIPYECGSQDMALYNADLRDVELRVDNNPMDLIICKKDGDKAFPIRNKELVLVSTLNPLPGEIYGTSILKGLPFVSNILLKIYHSIGVNWERVGNIRFAVTYKPGNDAAERAYAKERAMQIATEWSKTMRSDGGINDFVAVGDVDIKVIGADNQILDSLVPVKQMLEQIVAKLSIPPCFLGLSWSTSERMSTQQADLLTSELNAYRRILNPVIRKICNMWLVSKGLFTEYEIKWSDINLQDRVQVANARLLEARAMEIEKRLSE